MDSFFGFIIQNDSLAMIVIALKYEDSKSKWSRIQIQYQLKFGMPQAGYKGIKYDITEAENSYIHWIAKEIGCRLLSRKYEVIWSDLVVNIQSE